MDDLDLNLLWEGTSLCCKNATALLSVSKEAAKQHLYGSATSLAILSAEESAKGLGLMIQGISTNPKDISIKKYFYDHKHKHNAGAAIMMGMKLMDIITSEISSIEEKSLKDTDKGSILVSRLIDVAEQELSGERKTFYDLDQWRSNADTAKKDGFYVSLKNNKWVSPNDISEDIFVTYKRRANDMLHICTEIHTMGAKDATKSYQQFYEQQS